jgi:hypothetical protein
VASPRGFESRHSVIAGAQGRQQVISRIFPRLPILS